MLRDIRKQYLFSTLDEREVCEHPFDQFRDWLQQAIDGHLVEPNAMVLSTVDEEFQPHARYVLLKEVSNDGFIFYTNYEGNKGQQIANNNKVSLLFFWPDYERQVRITGQAVMIPEWASDDYFQSRPLESQLAAWASPQSQPIPSHRMLEERVEYFKKQFGDTIPKPSHWGGYLVIPYSFEFWQGRPNRLHDRIQYTADGENWKICRLAP